MKVCGKLTKYLLSTKLIYDVISITLERRCRVAKLIWAVAQDVVKCGVRKVYSRTPLP